MTWLVAYIGTIFAANWAIMAFGPVPVGFGLLAPAGVYFAGLAFTFRDLVHDRLGRRAVLLAILVGAGLSAWLSGPLALASGTAFLLSEAADFAVYAPLRRRGFALALLASNTVGLVLDSALFLWLAFGSWAFLPGQIVGKAWMTLVPAHVYAAEVKRYADVIGGLAWAAPQDWMCEPKMLAKTGFTVAEHQTRTVANYLDLRSLDAPVIPVLQGWELGDYLNHIEQYSRAGVALDREPLVGLGTVCRRQNMAIAEEIVRALAPIRLHGFGIKLTGLGRFADALASADSMAWSYRARSAWRHERKSLCTGCTRGCANCFRWAMEWRERVLTCNLWMGAGRPAPEGP